MKSPREQWLEDQWKALADELAGARASKTKGGMHDNCPPVLAGCPPSVLSYLEKWTRVALDPQQAPKRIERAIISFLAGSKKPVPASELGNDIAVITGAQKKFVEEVLTQMIAEGKICLRGNPVAPLFGDPFAPIFGLYYTLP